MVTLMARSRFNDPIEPMTLQNIRENGNGTGSVIIAGARLWHFCAYQPFVLYITEARTVRSAAGQSH